MLETNNSFYTTFDTATWQRRSKDRYRTPFQKDRDRIVHGPAFRRLQGKTQVFLTGEYDFYRTRLTHSIEVAQIGRSICSVLLRKGPPLKENYYIDADLVEAACLAHDIGNPPFGHAGERTLHRIMQEYGGFEDNAQSLRLVTEMSYGKMGTKQGMKPTRSLVDALLKYKVIYDTGTRAPEKKFLYPDQDRYLDFVFGGTDWRSRALNLPQSIECQIMELADDIAYSIDDLKDAAVAGFLSSSVITKWMARESRLAPNVRERLTDLSNSIDRGDCDSHLSERMGYLITGVSLGPANNFMSKRSNRYRYCLKTDDLVVRERKAYSKLAYDVVFSTAKVQQLEFKADHVLNRLFMALLENYSSQEPLHLLPEDWHNYLKSRKDASDRARTACDFISGMTDAFAGRAYQRIFLPDYGSLTDLV